MLMRTPPRPAETVSCAQCGKEFLIRPSRREKSVSGNVFCSPQCAGQHYATTLPHNATCDYCGKSFHRSPSGLNRYGQKHVYCSQECNHSAQRAGMSIRQPATWTDGEQVSCDTCGKRIHKSPSQLKAHEHHFCSRKCMGQFYTTSGVGAITAKRALSIQEIGAFCQICGITDLDLLVIHHKDGNRKNNARANLMVVCANCHWRIHKGILREYTALLKGR